MIITLYQYSGKNNVVNKTLSNGVNVDGTLKDASNVLRPIVKFRTKTDLQNIASYNYVYIAALNRYYFVNSVDILATDTFLLSLSVDVLKTYENEIAAASGTILNRENGNKFISNRANIHDLRPTFEKIDFSVNAPFDADGTLIMVTLKGNTNN